MFDAAKIYAAGIGAVVVLAGVGYLLYTYSSTQKENKALSTQVTTQKIEIKDLGKTVEVTKKAGDIDQQAVTGAVQEHKSVERKFDTIQRQSADREIQLRQAAAKPQPAASGVVAVGSAAVTPVSEYKDSVPTELEGQIGLLRLTSLWQAYCLAAPAAAECKEAAQ